MTPNEIKSQLVLHGVSQTEIARRAGNVSRGHIGRVITRQSISAPVEKQIARAIGKQLHEVFPDRYDKPRKKSLERLDEEPERAVV